MKNKYEIGDIVTLKSHPLLKTKYIKGDGNLVPPYMVVTEVFHEDKKKRTHSENLGVIIADFIKYGCVFFDDNRLEFKETTLYESNIELKEKGKMTTNYLEKYNFGNVISFKTKDIELLKQRESTKKIITTFKNKERKDEIKETVVTTIQNIVNYSSPDFVLTGIKKK